MLRLANKQYPPVTSQQRSEPSRKVWPGRLLLVVILVIIGTVFWQRQAISDWIQLYGYEPPVRIAELASQTAMSDDGRHLFYLNKPLIAGKSNFGQYCTDREHTIVLGCYHSGQSGIFLLNISDNSELHGVMQVTAAHEMLHAAYERLSASEKGRINALLQDYYTTKLTDQSVKDEIDSYRKTEPDSLLNEMHSIFATEIAELPAQLEEYYDQYFLDRQAVVRQAEQYRDAFRKREAAIEQYDAELKKLQSQITANEQTISDLGKQLQRERQRLNNYKNSGNVSAYNAAVPGYNSLVRSYNSLLEETKRKIAEYNIIVQVRNKLVVEEQQLVQQLSGSELPDAQ